MARLRRDGQRLHAPGLDVVRHRAKILEGIVDLAAHDVGLAGCPTAVGDMHGKGAGHLLQELRGQMIGRARAAGTVRQAPRILLSQLDELLQRTRRQVGPRDEHVGRGHGERDRREVAHRLVAQVLEERGVD